MLNNNAIDVETFYFIHTKQDNNENLCKEIASKVCFYCVKCNLKNTR